MAESERIVLRDGTQLLVDPLSQEDREQLREGIEHLSPDSRYRRFLTPATHVSNQQVLGFGIAFAVPRLAAAVEAPLSRLARFGPSGAGHGFASGLLVGAALGFAYAPCAEPILAAVITVGAASGRVVPIAIAYSAGSAAVLLVLALGGRRLADRVAGRGEGPRCSARWGS